MKPQELTFLEMRGNIAILYLQDIDSKGRRVLRTITEKEYKQRRALGMTRGQIMEGLLLQS